MYTRQTYTLEERVSPWNGQWQNYHCVILYFQVYEYLCIFRNVFYPQFGLPNFHISGVSTFACTVLQKVQVWFGNDSYSTEHK